MSRQVLHDGRSLRVRFAYDTRLVELVKTLGERRWVAEGKYWSVPDRDVVSLVDLLAPEGFSFDEATRSLYRSRGGRSLGFESLPENERPPLRGLFDDGLAPDPHEGPTGDFTVSRLNAEVRAVLARAFPAPLWLVGEISGYNKSAHKRIVGFHLVERDPSGRSIAEVQAVLFEDNRTEIARRLAAAGDPFRLEDEVTVRVLGAVELYEAWGQYRLRILDLDLAFTLGETARRREEIVRKLTAEGILERNRSLPFPELPLRVGFVTSLGSDAFNDVRRTLEESGFAFRLTVHGARVQGRSTEPSVLNALDWFRARAVDFDVLLVCRGGGSRTDLAWLDSEAIGRAVANFPIPVVVGIGHEQDLSVLDFVGWRCKTPTAAAGFVVERVADAMERVETSGRTILEAALSHLARRTVELGEGARRVARAAGRVLERESSETGHRRARVARGARAVLSGSRGELVRQGFRIPRAAALLLERRAVTLSLAARQLAQGASRDVAAGSRKVSDLAGALGPRSSRWLAHETERTLARARRVALVDPRRVVERGFAILRGIEGRSISGPRDAPAGAEVRAELRDGRLRLRSEGPWVEKGGS